MTGTGMCGDGQCRKGEGAIKHDVVVLPSGFPEPFFSDLRRQADLVQIIGETVPLTRFGQTLKGLCPFHSEKTPSFHVNPDKGFFHCFGCGAGGDVFKFIERRDDVTFREAVHILAARYGVEIPA